MSFDRVGPPLETLTHRLAETPREFLDEPNIQGRGQVSVAALVHDLMTSLGHAPSAPFLAAFQGRSRDSDRNRLSVAAIVVWLLGDDWFGQAAPGEAAVSTLLTETVGVLAAAAQADRYAVDPDRREELARTALAALDARPEGETAQQAADRLTAVSGAERQRLLRASRDADLRAKAVREALIAKAAQESADKWTRE